jgi:3',5'-cyclic AMP phosphodiesterase CpdA
MARARLLVVSDTHLSARSPEGDANWDAILTYVDAQPVDLVVHLGDLSLDGAHDPDDLVHARKQLDHLPVPWIALPGNHDVGDNPGGTDPPIGVEGLRRWEADVGVDHWAHSLAGWTLIGVNAQLFDSGLTAEAEQWRWLGECVDGRPTVFFTHKPMFAGDTELRTAPAYRFVPESARARLEHHFLGRALPLVVSGHVHQYRTLAEPDRTHVWAPTAWAVIPEHIQRTVGLKRCGVLLVELGPDGRADAQLVEPPGLRQLTVGVDTPDFYGH